MTEMVVVAPGHWLAPQPALGYTRALRDGCPPGITSAGRTRAEQEAMYARYLRGELEATAAVPGTSRHEVGAALDLPEPAQSWMRQWGQSYGWVKDRVRNEPWHFEYVAALDKHATARPAPAGQTQEDPMPIIIRNKTNGAAFLLDAGKAAGIERGEDLTELQAEGIRCADVTGATYDRFARSYGLGK